LTLEQLAEQTGLSRSALGSYESDEFKDISHYALSVAKFYYGVTADFLRGLAETRNHPKRRACGAAF
jgi:transcriptional regulator with XRE-family HTH domain